ncbi:hypothetical protein, partial [Type-E symbiont of Plautia stali]|uniref:hypothetical protein n=1 Tax=Type-E symbiont of Plautia stali TaxID=1560357 RepID=UPI0025706DF3
GGHLNLATTIKVRIIMIMLNCMFLMHTTHHAGLSDAHFYGANSRSSDLFHKCIKFSLLSL